MEFIYEVTNTVIEHFRRSFTIRVAVGGPITSECYFYEKLHSSDMLIDTINGVPELYLRGFAIFIPAQPSNV